MSYFYSDKCKDKGHSYSKSYSNGRSIQEVFCGVPTGKVVANEFKGSTKKKVFLYLLRSGGKTYVKVSNNQLRYLWNSLRPCLQHIRYTLLSVNHRKFSLNRARKKIF